MKIEIHLNEYEDYNPMTFASEIINMRLLGKPMTMDIYASEVRWIEQLSEHLAIWVKHAKEIINE